VGFDRVAIGLTCLDAEVESRNYYDASFPVSIAQWR
jgi:hypothetical protein